MAGNWSAGSNFATNWSQGTGGRDLAAGTWSQSAGGTGACWKEVGAGIPGQHLEAGCPTSIVPPPFHEKGGGRACQQYQLFHNLLQKVFLKNSTYRRQQKLEKGKWEGKSCSTVTGRTVPGWNDEGRDRQGRRNLEKELAEHLRPGPWMTAARQELGRKQPDEHWKDSRQRLAGTN